MQQTCHYRTLKAIIRDAEARDGVFDTASTVATYDPAPSSFSGMLEQCRDGLAGSSGV